MNKIYSQYNLDRLRLQQSQKDSIKLERSDYKRGNGKNGIRKIFAILDTHKHDYDIYEHQQLDAFRKEIEDEDKHLLTDDVIMRFLYANHFDFPQTIKVTYQSIKHLKSHQDWMNDINNFKWSLNTEELIKSGSLYISGRGVNYKPIIVINADKLDIGMYPLEDIIRALVIVFMVARDYMLEPGKVESWYVIIEATNTTAYSIPFTHLNAIFDCLKQNFPCYLERMFILQPQTSIQITWQIVEQFIPYNSRHKIEFVTKDYSLMFNYIKPKQLEIRHGGKAQNVYDYWPPHVDDFNEIDYMLKEQQESKKVQDQIKQLQKIMPFTSNIDPQISNLLRKQFKPKNKIYQEETYLDTQEYYHHKGETKTVVLSTPKLSKVITPTLNPQIEEYQEYQQYQKVTEVNASFEQVQLQQEIPIQSRFVGPKTKMSDSNSNSQHPIFQSRFVGPKTQHLFTKQDVSIISKREDLISPQQSQII